MRAGAFARALAEFGKNEAGVADPGEQLRRRDTRVHAITAVFRRAASAIYGAVAPRVLHLDNRQPGIGPCRRPDAAATDIAAQPRTP